MTMRQATMRQTQADQLEEGLTKKVMTMMIDDDDDDDDEYDDNDYDIDDDDDDISKGGTPGR